MPVYLPVTPCFQIDRILNVVIKLFGLESFTFIRVYTMFVAILIPTAVGTAFIATNHNASSFCQLVSKVTQGFAFPAPHMPVRNVIKFFTGYITYEVIERYKIH